MLPVDTPGLPKAEGMSAPPGGPGPSPVTTNHRLHTDFITTRCGK